MKAELEVETAMGDCKRVAVTTAASNAGCMSKRRRIAGSPERLRPSASRSRSRLEKRSSVGIVVGGDVCDQFPVSCSSGNDCRKVTAEKFEDLEQTKSFETVESTRVNGIQSLNLNLFRESTPTSNFHEESDGMETPATEKQKPADPPVKTPPISEIEDFFAEAEKYEQKRFSVKYNFDIVMDVPLEGRYQWIRLKP